MRKRKSVIVELTSLLDVIFIMLFMVMNQSRTAAEEAQSNAAAEVAAAQVQVEAMEEEVDRLGTTGQARGSFPGNGYPLPCNSEGS